MGTTSTFANQSTSAKTFIDGVLTGIGAPINAVTQQAMLDWLANEQGGPGLPAFTRNQGNPLGVQTSGAGLSGASGNVQGGINATVGNLSSPQYQSVVAAFRDGNSVAAIDQQIVNSPWNGQHYGGYKKFLQTAYGTAGPAGTPGGAGVMLSSAAQQTGCGAKVGSNPGAPNNIFTLPHTSVGLTYCQAKGLIGGALLFVGGTVMVLGIASLLVGALGAKAPKAAVAPSIIVARAAGRGVGRVRSRKSEAPAPEPEVEEVA